MATCGGPATAGSEADAAAVTPKRTNEVRRGSFAEHEPPQDGAEARVARRAGSLPSVAGVLKAEIF